MPVFRSGKGNAPQWAEVEDFEIITIGHDQTQVFSRRGEKEIYVVGRGMPVFATGDFECKPPAGGYVHLGRSRAEELSVCAWHHDVLLVRLVGHWGAIPTAGVFELCNVPNPTRDGSFYDAEKTSGLENHYHDYDEYWVFYEGQARVADGGAICDVGPGDCLATPMGWRHDCVSVPGDLRFNVVWAAGTPRGRKRIGHLHESRDGRARPSVPLPKGRR